MMELYRDYMHDGTHDNPLSLEVSSKTTLLQFTFFKYHRVTRHRADGDNCSVLSDYGTSA